MTLVINSALKMKPGKIASQSSHAAVSLYIKASSAMSSVPFLPNSVSIWLKLGQPKVVLKGLNDQHLLELQKQCAEASLLTEVIYDAGRTQIPTGSLTCLGVFGKSEQIDTITGSLPLL